MDAPCTPPVPEDCAICLECVEDGARCVLECGHTFHSACILQSVLHDQRCPVCRCTLAKALPKRQSFVEITMDEMEDAVQDEFRQMRRQQTNYDARRRRLVRCRAHLHREHEATKQLEQQLKAANGLLQKRWTDAARQLWRSEQFMEIKRQRRSIMSKIRQKQRVVDREVVEALGERPEIDMDDDTENRNVLARAVFRLGREVDDDAPAAA